VTQKQAARYPAYRSKLSETALNDSRRRCAEIGELASTMSPNIHAGTERQTSGAGVYRRRSAHQAGQHGSLVQALKRTGIENFRWHDLRHTWASWHVQGGTPLFELQELAGWETEKMVRRYAHLAAEHLAIYASNTESHGTTAGFPRHSPTASVRELRKFMVAKGGVEPPTRQF
jgi:hypothetical protein